MSIPIDWSAVTVHFNFEPVQSFSDEDLASQDRFQSVRYLQCDSILPVGGSSF